MIQITTEELSALSKNQREALAAFVITFPSRRMSVEETPLAAEERTVDEVFSLTPTTAASAPPPPSSGPVLVIPPTPSAVALDKAGIPWDERIHSSSKNFTDAGLWRRKRGVDDALVTQVEAQLKALAAPAPAPQPPAPALVATEAPAPPPPPATAAAPAPPPPPAPDSNAAFLAIVKKVSEAVNAKRITQAEIIAICTQLGIETFASLGANRDKIPEFEAQIDATLIGR